MQCQGLKLAKTNEEHQKILHPAHNFPLTFVDKYEVAKLQPSADFVIVDGRARKRGLGLYATVLLELSIRR